MDLGKPASYAVLEAGTSVYSVDHAEIGKVTHVLADADEDIFDGIVVGAHPFGAGHRFVDAEDVQEIFERGVILKLDRAACAQLPEPSANPAVMHDDPAEPGPGSGRRRLARAWDLISGKR